MAFCFFLYSTQSTTFRFGTLSNAPVLCVTTVYPLASPLNGDLEISQADGHHRFFQLETDFTCGNRVIVVEGENGKQSRNSFSMFWFFSGHWFLTAPYSSTYKATAEMATSDGLLFSSFFVTERYLFFIRKTQMLAARRNIRIPPSSIIYPRKVAVALP